MIRAVLDTNVLISGVILPRGVSFLILEAWHSGLFKLVTSDAQYAELERVLHRPRIFEKYQLSQSGIAAVLRRIRRDADFVRIEGVQSPVPVRDRDDEKILITAIEGRVDFLVSGDDDLLVLAAGGEETPARIVSTRAFYEIVTDLSKDS